MTAPHAPLDPATRAPAVRRGPAVAVLGVALALALLPLVPVFGADAILAPAVGGLVLGTLVALVGAARRWPVLVTMAVAVLTYLAAGSPLAVPGATVAGVLPTADSVLMLLTGAITVWKQVLTLEPALGTAGNVLVAPFLLAYVGALTSLAVALRARSAAWAAVVPPLVLALSVLLGTKETVLPVVVGVVLGAMLLLWTASVRGAVQPRRALALVLMAAVVAAGGGVAGPLLGEQRPRYVLRDEIVPPFDPRDHPSPLSAFRAFVKDWKETELLTVRGLPEDVPVRLAVMDAFDGVVWNVAGSEAAEGSGTFRRVGDTIDTTVRGERTTVEVQVHDLPMVWLPTVGYATGFRFTGAADQRNRLRYNDATGTAVLTDGVAPGTTYTLDAVVPEVPGEEQVSASGVASVSLPEAEAVPDAVPLYAGEIAGTATSPGLIALSLEAGLADRGWFSHGLTDAGDHPSLSGHGADRVTTLLTGDLMVGDAEQYASAMALMAREMGLPARVVLGFVPEQPEGGADEVTVTGDDVEAWVEVALTGYGWVPFFPTPPESKTPQEDTPEEQTEPQPQVMQPPPPPEDPVRPPDDDAEQPRTEDSGAEDDPSQVWRDVLVIALTVSLPLALLVLPLLLVMAAKDRRRRRRRTSGDPVSQVVGGWDEVLDHARDLRRPVRATATRRETAVELATAFAAAGRSGTGGGDGRRSRRGERRTPAVGGPVAGLAAGADAAVFGPGDPGPDQVEAYWHQVDATLATMRAAVPRRRWALARISLASLRGRRRGARPPGRGGVD